LEKNNYSTAIKEVLILKKPSL